MENKYELIVKINGEMKESGGTETDPTEKLTSFVKASVVMPFINMTKGYITQNVGLVTGSQDLQQKTDFITSVIQTGFQANTMRLAGVALGVKLGIGGLAGGAMGLALYGFQKTMEISFRQAEINLQADRENYQLQQTRSRAGIAFNRSRQGA